MKPNLDTLIQETARNGRFAGLTLWPTPEGLFQANVSEGQGWRVEIDADPAAALLRALGRRDMPSPSVSDLKTDNDPTPNGSIFD